MDLSFRRSSGAATEKHREVQTELAEWEQVSERCWRRGMREWGSKQALWWRDDGLAKEKASAWAHLFLLHAEG
jgi:hypothetical protein